MSYMKSVIAGSFAGAMIATLSAVCLGPGFAHSQTTTDTFQGRNSSVSTTLTEIEVPGLSIALICLGAVGGGLAGAGISVILRKRKS
jgi:hypothetical protein